MELLSWFFMKTGLNSRAIDAIDIKKIVTQFNDFCPYIILGFFVIAIIIILPIYQKVIRIPKIALLILTGNFLFFFIYILSVIHDFDNINNSLFDQSSDIFYMYLKQMLYNKFEMTPKVLSTTNNLKNLFLVQLESYPNEFVQNPQISPNLNRYMKQYEYISPIAAQLYTVWSLTGTSVLQTGIPQIYPESFDKIAAKKTDYEYITGIKGIPNILHSYGYNLDYAVTSENSLMGFDEWIKAHEYKRVFTGINDLYLYDFMAFQYLPMLDKRARDSNFKNLTLTYMLNIQTHTPYKRPIWFPRKKINVPLPIHQCFFCCDFGINKVISKFLELKMYEHTVMVVFPDHPPFNIDEKEMFWLFPGMEKVDPKNKLNISDITYYDFAPTILDMIGIKSYQPDFPFGKNIYLNSNNDHSNYCVNQNCIKKHRKPDLNDLSIIHKYLHFDHGRNIKPKYNISELFSCTINGTVHYSDKPCHLRNKAIG